MADETRGWEGPERRRESLKLDDALAEVQRLNAAATTLASAVANTAHRSELDSLSTEVRRDFQIKMIFQAVLTVVALVILISYMQVKFSHQDRDVQKGHEIITCLQGKTEAQRTGDLADTSRIACEQSVR